MQLNAAGYIQMQQAELTDGTLGWTATDPARPGCVGYGETEEAARESLSRARKAYDRARAAEDAETHEPELFDQSWDRSGSEPAGSEVTATR